MTSYKYSFVAGILFLICFAAQAQAWHVTVFNPTDRKTEVASLVVYSDLACTLHKRVSILPHSKHTFKTGAYCPCALSGCFAGELGEGIAKTCLGPMREKEHFPCYPNCHNSQWTIVQHDDGTWHFKKGTPEDHETYNESPEDNYNPDDQ